MTVASTDARLTEYLVKGFTLDDERLKNPPGPGQTDYFDELLERIRDIRSSDRRFHQKVLDIWATSMDYSPDTEISQSQCRNERRVLPPCTTKEWEMMSLFSIFQSLRGPRGTTGTVSEKPRTGHCARSENGTHR